MTERFKPLLDRATLRNTQSLEYAAFRNTPAEQALYDRLRAWSQRSIVGETARLFGLTDAEERLVGAG